ncbi:MAG TPA: type II toxin-antitoxin system RelE/ParE family toxin [Acetobacteraceae bacterium]|nr:type II toxin-antitoxin system RelE/ParE family toxin [Acetobacteraceae bacterium]
MYRAVYTVKFSAAVCVLHCFQKKATRGIATPKPELDLIARRLKAAEAHAKGAKARWRSRKAPPTSMPISVGPMPTRC